MLSSLKTTFLPLAKIPCLMIVGPKHSLSSLCNYQEMFTNASLTMYTIFLSILLTELSNIVALQPDMISVHTCGTESLLFALEILFIIFSCFVIIFGVYHGEPNP